jgi:hypothetical protein
MGGKEGGCSHVHTVILDLSTLWMVGESVLNKQISKKGC